MTNPDSFDAKLDAALESIKPAEPSIDEKLAFLARLSVKNDKQIGGLIGRSNEIVRALTQLSNENAQLQRAVLDLLQRVGELEDRADERRGEWLRGINRRIWN